VDFVTERGLAMNIKRLAAGLVMVIIVGHKIMRKTL
jgi:hypothetical protein